MTQPTQRAPHDALDTFFDAIRGWGVRRRASDRWLGGVCSGIADRFGVDPVVVRAALVVLAVFGGAGITAYLLALALLPDNRGVSAAEKAIRHGDGDSVLLIVITLIALFSGLPWWLHRDGFWGAPWGLLVVAVAIFWWRRGHRHHGRSRATAESPAGAPASWSAAGYPAPPSTAVSTDGWQDGSDAAATPAASPAAAAAPAPVARRRRSGGLLALLVGVGAALLAYGAVLWAADQLSWSGEHRVVAMASALGVLGLVVAGLGIAGLRSGLLGPLAVFLGALTLAAGSVGHLDRFGGRVGDSVWRPTSLPVAAPYRLLVGQGRLDLRRLTPVQGGMPVPVQQASIGTGELDILVPAGVTVQVDAHVGLGQVTGPDDARAKGDDAGDDDGDGGSDVTRSITVGSGIPQVIVSADVLVGQITVTKES